MRSRLWLTLACTVQLGLSWEHDLAPQWPSDKPLLLDSSGCQRMLLKQGFWFLLCCYPLFFFNADASMKDVGQGQVPQIPKETEAREVTTTYPRSQHQQEFVLDSKSAILAPWPAFF